LLLLLTGIGFGLLLALTPGVGDAPARVATQTRGGGLLVGSPPLRVQQALVATEDSRFYSHSGVDPIGSLRAVLGPLLGQADPGGATLDQQLAKLLYTGGRRTLTDRIEQVALAVKIDHRYSKPEILRLYLDTAYFGHSYTGIAAAARGFSAAGPRTSAGPRRACSPAWFRRPARTTRSPTSHWLVPGSGTCSTGSLPPAC